MEFEGLDVATLILTNASVSLFLALIFWLYQANAKTYYGFYYWFAGALLAAASLTIPLSSRFIPVWAIVLLFHTTYMLAMMVRLEGTIRFTTGKKLHPAFYLIPLLLGLTVELNYLYASSQSLRYLMHATVLLAITYATAWYLLRNVEKEKRGLYYLAGTFLIARGSLTMFRAIHWYLHPDIPLYNNELLHGITLLAEIICEMVIAVSFIMMNGKRTEIHLIASDNQAQTALLEVQRLANHDHLTGLASLHLTKDRLGHSIMRARRDDSKVAIMFMDLNGFKPVNDKYGHDIGDRVLIEIANRLQRCARESDTVGRIGGDEFVYILEGVHDRKDIERIGKNIMAVVSEPISLDGIELSVGISIGVAIYPDNGLEDTELLKAADQAMYRAKSSSKDPIEFSGNIPLADESERKQVGT